MQFVSSVQSNSKSAIGTVRQGVNSAAWVFAFVLLLALSAQVKFPLPFTPVPVTLQTLVVVMAGAVLGPWLGLSAVVAYLAAGLIGLPVFAGASGVATLSGATGGYLLAFLVATPIVGLITRTGTDWVRVLIAGLLAHATILTIGAAWLGAWGHMSLSTMLVMGVIPFIPGTMLKVAIAALVTPKLIGRR